MTYDESILGKIIPIVDKNSNAAQLVGHIILAYSEVEFRMMGIIEKALNSQREAAELLFKVRGEKRRLKILEDSCGDYFDALELSEDFRAVIKAIDVSREFRNQYAHGTWSKSSQTLKLFDLEASVVNFDGSAIYRSISEELIKKQALWVFHTCMAVSALKAKLDQSQLNTLYVEGALQIRGEIPPRYLDG